MALLSAINQFSYDCICVPIVITTLRVRLKRVPVTCLRKEPRNNNNDNTRQGTVRTDNDDDGERLVGKEPTTTYQNKPSVTIANCTPLNLSHHSPTIINRTNRIQPVTVLNTIIERLPEHMSVVTLYRIFTDLGLLQPNIRKFLVISKTS